jgi:hypothetical protein
MQRSIIIPLFAMALTVPAMRSLHAVEVADSFETADNPNGWSWLSGTPSNIVHNGTVQPTGGNPGGWFDSNAPYFAGHPNFTAIPEAGTPLHAALASAALETLTVDIQRLDTSAVTNCHPVYDLPSTYTLELLDLHTLGTNPPTPIEAHTTDGPASPEGTSYPWTAVNFTIPSDATDVPPGWVLNVPPDITYTWADLMHNLDGISVYAIDPGEITFDSCWELGADNVVVTYRDNDGIFADGFEVAPAN